jgi:hypothetical protein
MYAAPIKREVPPEKANEFGLVHEAILRREEVRAAGLKLDLSRPCSLLR